MLQDRFGPHEGWETVRSRPPASSTLDGARARRTRPRTPFRPVPTGFHATGLPSGAWGAPMTNVDPADLTLWPTIRHLYPLWRAQWRLVAIGLSCAVVFTVLSLAIPILVQRTIDDAIDGNDHSLSCRTSSRSSRSQRSGSSSTSPGAMPRRGSGSPSRRVCARSCTTRTCAIRAPSTTATQPARSSRAPTNDIYPVRYFIGWGVVQAIQSTLMLVGATIVLTAVNWQLALTAAVAMPPIAVLTYFFAHRVFPISREVQRKKGQPHRGIGRGRGRHRDGAGIRPRGRRARPLPRAARRAVR